MKDEIESLGRASESREIPNRPKLGRSVNSLANMYGCDVVLLCGNVVLKSQSLGTELLSVLICRSIVL